MPILEDDGHERFAQGLAEGLSAAESYRQAGYPQSKHAPSQLRDTPHVSDRVAELRAAQRVAPAAVTQRLLAIVDAAGELKSAAGLAVARAALMDAARLNGVAPPPKRQDTIPAVVTVYADEPLSEEEWLSLYAPET